MLHNNIVFGFPFLFFLNSCGGGIDNPLDIKISNINILDGISYKSCESSTQTTYKFKLNKTGVKTVQVFSDSDCTTIAAPAVATDFTFVLDTEITANDGVAATKINILESGTTVYTLIRLSGGNATNNMNFGSTVTSSPGHDGSTNDKRHDGINLVVNYTLQT